LPRRYRTFLATNEFPSVMFWLVQTAGIALGAAAAPIVTWAQPEHIAVTRPTQSASAIRIIRYPPDRLAGRLLMRHTGQTFNYHANVDSFYRNETIGSHQPDGWS